MLSPCYDEGTKSEEVEKWNMKQCFNRCWILLIVE